MKDTIGHHQVWALRYSAGAARTYAINGPVLDIAAQQGAALGHAFRAAELAYDLGQKHGPRRVVLVLPGKLEMIMIEGTITV